MPGPVRQLLRRASGDLTSVPTVYTLALLSQKIVSDYDTNGPLGTEDGKY
jgi:hypothetical protein